MIKNVNNISTSAELAKCKGVTYTSKTKKYTLNSGGTPHPGKGSTVYIKVSLDPKPPGPSTGL